MMQPRNAWLLLLAPLLFAGGCSKFAGEWVEEGLVSKDGSLTRLEGDRRLALKFNPPATVRYGAYLAPAGVVDRETVQHDTYFTMKWGRVAQFGGMTLRAEGKNHLAAYVSGEVTRRFKRVRGPSVFPPQPILPSLAKAAGQPAGLLPKEEPAFGSQEFALGRHD